MIYAISITFGPEMAQKGLRNLKRLERFGERVRAEIRPHSLDWRGGDLLQKIEGNPGVYNTRISLNLYVEGEKKVCRAIARQAVKGIENGEVQVVKILEPTEPEIEEISFAELLQS